MFIFEFWSGYYSACGREKAPLKVILVAWIKNPLPLPKAQISESTSTSWTQDVKSWSLIFVPDNRKTFKKQTDIRTAGCTTYPYLKGGTWWTKIVRDLKRESHRTSVKSRSTGGTLLRLYVENKNDRQLFGPVHGWQKRSLCFRFNVECETASAD